MTPDFALFFAIFALFLRFHAFGGFCGVGCCFCVLIVFGDICLVLYIMNRRVFIIYMNGLKSEDVATNQASGPVPIATGAYISQLQKFSEQNFKLSPL